MSLSKIQVSYNSCSKNIFQIVINLNYILFINICFLKKEIVSHIFYLHNMD